MKKIKKLLSIHFEKYQSILKIKPSVTLFFSVTNFKSDLMQIMKVQYTHGF